MMGGAYPGGAHLSGRMRALREPLPALAREFWIVAHADLTHTARVRAFFGVVADGLAAERAVRGPPRRQTMKDWRVKSRA
jgi:hypothetical protein